MRPPHPPFHEPLGLLTDLYQLTMVYGYWRQGLAERDAVFHLTFRRAPFGGRHAVACGAGSVVEMFRAYRFDPEDLAYLAGVCGSDDRPLFSSEFLDYLQGWTFACDVDAVEEGTAVFANEPLWRIRGPLWQCQLLETPLLNLVNFQTLIATKASRVVQAAAHDRVIDFGLRRAQGIDGALSASRAAYIGGCHATSNVLAGKRYGIPVAGTHAHSWVMVFEDEMESFQAYAEALPNNCLFLVDTYDTLTGVERAMEVGRQLRRNGHTMLGIRLDSGDLLELSQAARRCLDEGGFPDAVVVASNDLDEYEIVRLKEAGARIDVWGVGTRLVTAYDQPALGGVYKLSALRGPSGEWEDRIKLSEERVKVSTPGILQVRRFRRAGRATGDVIYDERAGLGDPPQAVIGDGVRVMEGDAWEDLLVPLYRRGELVREPLLPAAARHRAESELLSLPPGVRKLHQPDDYAVGLEAEWSRHRSAMIESAGGSGCD